MSDPQGGCEVFVQLALKQIVDICNKDRKVGKIGQTCQGLLDGLASKKERITTDTVGQYVLPMKAACETGDFKLVLAALKCLQKLMAYRLVFSDVTHLVPPKGGSAEGTELVRRPVLNTVVSIVHSCAKFQHDPIHLECIRCLLEAVTVCEAHEGALESAASTVFSLMLYSRDPVNSTTARTTLTQMINIIFNRMENMGDKAVLKGNSEAPRITSPKSPVKGGSFKSDRKSIPYEIRDAQIIFIMLCRTSKVDVTEHTLADDHRMRRCLFALDFIQKILAGSGKVFRNSAAFLNGIRESLCSTLLKHCVSPVPAIFETSVNIFVTLICHFKRYLKNEIGVLLTNLFLKFLESPNTPYGQKTEVIKALQKVSSNPQVLIDLFLNYDCSLQEENILERIVLSMSKMTQTEHSEVNWIEPRQAQMLQQLSLHTLVTILISLVRWMRKFNGNGGERVPDDDDDESTLYYIEQQAKEAEAKEAQNGSSEPNSATKPKVPISEMLEKQRQHKLEVEKGVALFNKKPAKGIKLLQEQGLVGEGPEELGIFLRQTSGFNKSVVGDYLGGEEEFCQKILYHYVNTMDFRGLPIDEAVRKFLSSFSLPGEGQKIERILEQFSEVYVDHDTSKMFQCKDAVYILAVAIVMLNTDLHNAQVKEKMSKPQFLSQLRGINDGKDLPTEFTEGIYDRILERPFANDEMGIVHTAAAAETLAVLGITGSTMFLSKKEKKQMQYTVESRSMAKQTKDLLSSSQANSPEQYFAANDISYVRPIFSVIWMPCLAAISVSLENASEPGPNPEDNALIRFCLDGFECGIHIASMFEMSTGREAFVSALAKMTYVSNLKQIGPKNIESIRTLIKIAHIEGNFLQDSWMEVIRTISQLERCQIIGRAAHAGRPTQEGAAKPMDDYNAQMITTEIPEQSINEIFANSIHLSQEGLVGFVECLCEVAREEIINNPVPRMYCLQKLVEVASDNLGQRLVGIWSSISTVLVEVACNSKSPMATMAIDSLRQMVMKCLEQEELIQCQLQPEFLDPFYRIISGSSDCQETSDLILRCLHQLVLKKAHVIQSGWSFVFRALEVAASSTHGEIVKLGFSIVHSILKDFFGCIADHLGFSKAMHALYSFSSTSISPVHMDALNTFPMAAKALADTIASDPETFDDPEQTTWQTLLLDVSLLTFKESPATRIRALEILRDIIAAYGNMILDSCWPHVFKRVLFEMVTHPVWPDPSNNNPVVKTVSRQEWMNTTCQPALSLVRDLLFANFKIPQFQEVLHEWLDLLVRYIAQDEKECIRIGLAMFHDTLQVLGRQLNPQQLALAIDKWKAILETCYITPPILQPYMHAARSSSPAFDVLRQQIEPVRVVPLPDVPVEQELKNFASESHLVNHLLFKMFRQDQASALMEKMLLGGPDSAMQPHVAKILQCLLTFHVSLATFHSEELSKWRLGLFGQGGQCVTLLTQVISQQSKTLSLYFKLAFESTSKSADPEWPKNLLSAMAEILYRYLQVTSPQPTASNGIEEGPARMPVQLTEAFGLVPVVVAIINQACLWDENMFMTHLCKLHPLMLELIASDSLAIRQEVKKFFALWTKYVGA